MNPTFSWDQLSEFITNLREDFDRQNQKQNEEQQGPSNPIIQKWTSGTVLFSRIDLGGLYLDEETTAKYATCVRSLHSHLAGKSGQISRDAVEGAFQIAILRSLNITNNDPEPDFGARLTREIDELKRTLRQKPEVFVVRVEVQGLNQAQLPQRFGPFKFYMADESAIPEGPRVQDEAASPERLNRLESQRILRQNLVARVKGKTFAEIELEVFDRDAAMSLAESKLRRTLDVLNYFGEFFSEANARVSLPGEAVPTRRITIVGRKAEIDDSQIVFGNKGPLVPFSFPSKNSPPKSVEAFEKASRLLSRTNLNDLEERVVSALQWAGRAITDDRIDSAFLHSCISLETLLGNRQHNEITLAFALRAVHLVFRRDVRVEWLAKMKRYYRFRSGLAHSGTANVSDLDVATIRDILKQAIFTVLVTEPFCSMTKCDELDAWFEEQVLAGSAVPATQSDAG